MWNKRFVYIAEDISFPIDEGIKKYSYNLALFLNKFGKTDLFTGGKNKQLPEIQLLPRNKLFFSIILFKIIKRNNAKIIYVPTSSSTFASFLRLGILKFFTGKKTILISIQKRNHSYWQKKIIKFFLKPDLIFVFSEREKKYHEQFGCQVEITSIGVDIKKFMPILENQKKQLKIKYGLNLTRKVILHVGHINSKRNIKLLTEFINHGYEVVIIGSTRFEKDELLKEELISKGITIVDKFIESINEFYQMADLYVFPVWDDGAVIEFPLSILEAMACNIDILTTPFGSIPANFKETDSFQYFSENDLLITKANKLLNKKITSSNLNVEIVYDSYTWDKQFQQLIQKIEKI